MNRLFLFPLIAATFVATGQVPDYVPLNGLVAWYAFNSDVNDESGNGFHGVGEALSGDNYSTDRLGIPSASLSLSPGQFIQCPNWFESTPTQTEWTMTVWIKNNGETSEFAETIIGHRAHFKDKLILLQSDSLLIGDARISTALDYRVEVATEASDTNWHFLTMTNTAEQLSLFVDGETVGVTTRDGEADNWGDSYYGTFIGGNGHDPNWSNTFLGEIDDAGIWNRALSVSEIQGLYSGEPPTTGCTNPTACNYDEHAVNDDGSCIPSGCMEPLACNYNVLAECEGEACDYTCCPGPGCCLDGTVWDSELGGCTPLGTSCQGDLDFDGVVGVNDLMTLLSTFGTDCPDAEEPETTEWTCGDPVSYHGYDYATIQIGEQCWFAENLATALYLNEDSIPTGHLASEWSELSIGAYCNPSDGIEASSGYGLLYNWFAVTDPRAICPFNWHVPTDEEWSELTTTVGGADIAGEALKANAMLPIGWDGTDEFGFSAIPSGLRIWDSGQISFVGQNGYWWTVTEAQSKARDRQMYSGQQSIYSYVNDYRYGFSVRCLKD